jgi:iron(III) transport system ATP-binding protein
MSHSITLDDIVKSFDDFNAVDHISLKVENGEFFTLLGPSGCGKTTLLRMIAGFNSIDGGRILFDDRVINNIPANKRNIGMVFQNYAVFPHMTVEENVAYGLKARGIQKPELTNRVLDALRQMKIDTLKDRNPSQLSGGQQQRVALARAIVIHPDLLLMDEPLSNLDAKLRLEMRTVIRKLQQELKITTIYVTHDQDEALAISDRIAVVNAGKIAQIDKPAALYRSPSTRFVAGFIGTSNFLPGRAAADSFDILGKYPLPGALKNSYTGDILVAARPEPINIIGRDKSSLKGTVTAATFLGTHFEYEVTLDGGETILVNQYDETQKAHDYSAGDTVGLEFSADQMTVFNGEGTEVLL